MFISTKGVIIGSREIGVIIRSSVFDKVVGRFLKIKISVAYIKDILNCSQKIRTFFRILLAVESIALKV